MCCGPLHSAAVCYSLQQCLVCAQCGWPHCVKVLQNRVEQCTHCNTVQHTGKYSNALQRTAAHFNALHCNALQRTATHCNALQRTATHCNALQYTTTHCNTLQRSATHWNALQCITIKDCTLRVPNKRLSLVALLEAHMIEIFLSRHRWGTFKVESRMAHGDVDLRLAKGVDTEGLGYSW